MGHLIEIRVAWNLAVVEKGRKRSGTAKQNKAKEDKRQKNQAYEASRASQYWLLLLLGDFFSRFFPHRLAEPDPSPLKLGDR